MDDGVIVSEGKKIESNQIGMLSKRGEIWYLVLLMLAVLGPLLSHASSLDDNPIICFHGNEAGERGTERALFDYAYYGQSLLGYRSTIVFPSYVRDSISKVNHTIADSLLSNSTLPYPSINGMNRKSSSLYRFQAYFPVHYYDVEDSSQSGGSNLVDLVQTSGCQVLYMAKAGERLSSPKFPESFSSIVPTAVHAVFSWAPHGDVYAGISKNIDPKRSSRYVPFMVVPPNDTEVQSSRTVTELLRKKWGIVANRTKVLCRHGGVDRFNIAFVKDSITRLISSKEFSANQLQFIFMNTQPFTPKTALFEQQVHYLPMTVGNKEHYFQLCDAMLHGRLEGETFGLAVAEFSIRNKPVLTCNCSKDQAHIDILGDKGFYFHNDQDLLALIRSLVQHGIPVKKNYNAYEDFVPEKVIQRFHNVFVSPLLGKYGDTAVKAWRKKHSKKVRKVFHSKNDTWYLSSPPTKL